MRGRFHRSIHISTGPQQCAELCHRALYRDADTTLDDLRKAVTTLVETERTARRVLGRTHPTVVGMEESLRNARAALRARETPSTR